MTRNIFPYIGDGGSELIECGGDEGIEVGFVIKPPSYLPIY